MLQINLLIIRAVINRNPRMIATSSNIATGRRANANTTTNILTQRIKYRIYNCCVRETIIRLFNLLKPLPCGASSRRHKTPQRRRLYYKLTTPGTKTYRSILQMQLASISASLFILAVSCAPFDNQAAEVGNLRKKINKLTP